ncbi:MAG TPA: biotin--[acetyl-CoA-carboxylase] ligase [Hyphomicrobiaceae bacterium]|nr:biotin--[acetyl-CoA-carboxylase] ligase [Hyphomicrobiaceae bacterium]
MLDLDAAAGGLTRVQPSEAQTTRTLIIDQVGSTNREALALADAGCRAPLWLMARRQTAGRGRADRQWVSAAGNLHASLLLQLDSPPTAVAQLSLLAGVATIDAVRAATAGGPHGLRLKWPNDVLVGSAKCAGILVETTSSLPHAGDRPAPSLALAVIGVGIDLAWHPTGMHRAATDLAAHGCCVSPEMMLGSLDDAMRHWLAMWNGGRGFAAVRQGWLERAGPVGEMCTVDTGRERIEGAFAGLDPSGALIICDRHGQRRTVTFGDVALAAAAVAPEAPPSPPKKAS